MTELEKYRLAFNDCHFCQAQNILEEPEAGMQREVVAPEKLNYNLFRIEPNGANVFPYFRHKEGLNSMCDYMVFIEVADCVYAFAVELKKSVGNPRSQLARSEIFIRFVHDRMKLSDRLQPEKELIIGKIGISDKHSRPTTRNNGVEFDKEGFAKLYNRRAVYIEGWLRGIEKWSESRVV